MPICASVAGRSDIAEMAQMAAAETFAALATARTTSLFVTTSADVQRAFGGFCHIFVQFSELAREFFSQFSTRISDVLPEPRALRLRHAEMVGSNASTSTRTSMPLSACTADRRLASSKSSRVAGSPRATFEGGITPTKAAGFTHVALKKARARNSEKARRVREQRACRALRELGGRR